MLQESEQRGSMIQPQSEAESPEFCWRVAGGSPCSKRRSWCYPGSLGDGSSVRGTSGKELRFLPWNPPPKRQISPTFIPPRFTDYRMVPCTFPSGLSPSVAAPQVNHLQRRPLRFIWKCAVPTSQASFNPIKLAITMCHHNSQTLEVQVLFVRKTPSLGSRRMLTQTEVHSTCTDWIDGHIKNNNLKGKWPKMPGCSSSSGPTFTGRSHCSSLYTDHYILDHVTLWYCS